MVIRALAGGIVLAFLAQKVVLAQPSFTHSQVYFEVDLEAARQKAVGQHDGDLLVYFYRSSDPRHLAIDSVMFSDIRLSNYINENFGAFAADMDSRVGAQVFDVFNTGRTYDAPFVAITSKRNLRTTYLYGWHKASRWLDEYGFDGIGRKLLALIAAKELGQLPPKPGDPKWGEWSARLKELQRALAE